MSVVVSKTYKTNARSAVLITTKHQHPQQQQYCVMSSASFGPTSAVMNFFGSDKSVDQVILPFGSAIWPGCSGSVPASSFGNTRTCTRINAGFGVAGNRPRHLQHKILK